MSNASFIEQIFDFKKLHKLVQYYYCHANYSFEEQLGGVQQCIVNIN